ncbi:hypothetical protein P170DRAFT_509275 [Aspergillus steynii IBT 23096]|uniref:Uncharacterized protein n=1 Tax=Aspergillus steynii IBT 23096 TaxID=1392250 RepID=A0A2I2GED2_9EURO|nr:uncharacterized protein P170DRAFT_509275 [Aspergillus steynii IBT 23096]PLB51256.1 hypothetical protein P170DRAFT_509275 [Aspergillus steynii IBT 23096]
MVDEDEAKREDSPNPPPASTHNPQDDTVPQPHQQQDLPSDHHSPSVQGTHSGQNSGRLLPPIPTARQPVVRLPLCTHSVVERQHCVDHLERCDSCGRIPFLGWFFVCVEDTSGFSDPLDPIRGPFLSPWILKAIETGEYTVEEREVLIQQKLRVLRMADLERAPSSPSLSMLEAECEAGEHALQQRQTASSSANPGDSTTNLPAHPLPPLPCTLRACRHCERRFANLEERSWLSINEVCNDAIGPPAAFELAGRPVSDANIVRHLGWRSANSGSKTDDYPDRQAWSRNTSGSQLDFTDQELSALFDQVLNMAAAKDTKKDRTTGTDSDESGLSILIGLEVDDTSEAGDQDTCDGGVPLG